MSGRLREVWIGGTSLRVRGIQLLIVREMRQRSTPELCPDQCNIASQGQEAEPVENTRKKQSLKQEKSSK